MQPLQYDVRLTVAAENRITHAAAAARSLCAAIPLQSADTPHAAAGARNLDAAIPMRSAETALENTTGSETRYCRTHRLDTPVPMHKVPEHMQTTMAQRQQRREKETLYPHFHCACISRQIRRQSGDARNRRASEPT